MTGPLAPQFAKVREALPLMFARTREERAEAFDEIAAALSVIERHVQDTETALRGLLVETEPEQHRGTEPHPERGMIATLRDWIGDPEDYSDEDRGAAERAYDACDGVEAELSRLREQITELLQQESFMERKMAAQREDIERLAARVEAAEARCARLQQALAGLESAVRILDVMLREPAAEGLMSAEDYRSYVQGAWLGVDEAAEKARDALAGPDAQTSGSGSSAADPSAGERQGRQPDPGEIAGLLVELSRWSRVAELNGDLHARIASALAGPDTPADDEPCSCCDGEGCAYCTPADNQEDKT